MRTFKSFWASMRGPWRSALVASLIWIPFGFGVSAHSSAQTTAQEAAQATELTASLVVPQQVRYAGKISDRTGATVETEFRIYAAQEGGEPLWTETQQITVAKDGSYSVLLGSASPAGLPQTVFVGGAARWLGVSVDRGQEQERVLLPSVPYAMKSADAESLAGHAAADFVTQAQLASLAARQTAVPAPDVQSNTSGTVTGSGTANTVPLWTGSLTQGNSIITQASSKIGINEAAPVALLDVNGTENVRGMLTLPPNGTATTSGGYRSEILQLGASVWSSTAAAPVNQNFNLVTLSSANNTANPSGVLTFQYQNGTAPLANILSINSNGTINFSPSQTFPVKGTGGGTITGISTSSPLTGSGTTGSVALGLNQSTLVSDITPSLESTFNGVYPQLAASNTFTTNQTISGAVFGNMLTVSNAASSGSWAIYATNGVEYGDAIFAAGGDDGLGVQADAAQTAGSEGILGDSPNGDGNSNTYYSLYDNWAVGIWADASAGASLGLVATADNLTAALFENNSSGSPTLYLSNGGGGPTDVPKGMSTVLRAEGKGGVCGINQTGNLACTGQMKAVVAGKNSAREIETYTVQSAENWVEDYGSGELNHGSATIQVDAEFAETVNTGVEFHVFLTPGGDCKGLFVTNKTPGSFEVHELGGGTSSIPFDYKIVAKRNGMEGQRLVDVTDRMRTEAEAARPIPKAHLSPRKSGPRTHHVAVAGNAVTAIKR